MSDPLISIIIPVYNVEKYVARCIDSVLAQTYKNIEIIIVNDGSTDQSGEICKDYSNRDKRIKLINKTNGGLSDARNAALNCFNGEYVTFVDSDDYIAIDYIEYLYNLIISNNTNIAISQPYKVCSENKKINNKKEEIKIVDSEEAIESFLYQKLFTATAHCKLYSREIFAKIRYPFGYYYEDAAVIVHILSLCPRVVISNQMKYYYVQRQDSIMSGTFNPKKMHRIEISNNNLDFIKEFFPNLICAAECRCFLSGVQTLREIPTTLENKQFIDETWGVILKYRKNVLKDKKVKTTIKLMAVCSYLGRRFLTFLGGCFTFLRNCKFLLFN